jgi:hypothetical protein
MLSFNKTSHIVLQKPSPIFAYLCSTHESVCTWKLYNCDLYTSISADFILGNVETWDVFTVKISSQTHVFLTRSESHKKCAFFGNDALRKVLLNILRMR